jgi:molybdopterin converting factor small subunit
MQIRIKAMGMLRGKLPAGSHSGMVSLIVDEGSSIARVLEQLGVAAGQVHLVLVNGTMEHDRQRPLADGDELVLLPPVAGG